MTCDLPPLHPVSFDLRLDLESEVLLTATPTAAGPQTSLPVIPGGVLLGLFARAYNRLEEKGHSWSVFHDGGVRFGTARPLVKGRLLVPAPRSWGARKTCQSPLSSHAVSGSVDPVRPCDKREDKTSNLSKRRLDDLFVSGDGLVYRPDMQFRRRTAIDRASGRVKPAALFAYRALQADQSFGCRITCTEDLRAVVEEEIHTLCQEPQRIGRSRMVEYGRVRLSVLPTPPADETHGLKAGSSRVSILLVTDLALPRAAVPRADLFGLPHDWRLSEGASFFEWDTLVVFNSHRRAYDPTRPILRAGSVLTYEPRNPSVPALDEADIRRVTQTLDRGVGLGVERGLGVCLAEPALLAGGTALTPPSDLSEPTTVATPANDPLFQWLTTRHDARTLADEAREIGRRYEAPFARLYSALWKEAEVRNLPPQQMAPSPSQWGAVRDEAIQARDLEDLKDRLFGSDDGYCTSGTGAKPWKEVPPGLTLPGITEAPSALVLLQDAIDTAAEAKTAETDATKTALAKRVVGDLAVHIPRLMADPQGMKHLASLKESSS